MIIVSDTSALANLALVDQLWLLEELYGDVVIPDIVAQELHDATSSKIQSILCLNWIQVKLVTNPTMAEDLQQEQSLDPGESYAIVLALEQKADELLIDERRGRQVATRLGIPIIGLLGVLLLAKQHQHIPKIKPILDALIQQAGFRVSSQLYAEVLSQADEESS